MFQFSNARLPIALMILSLQFVMPWVAHAVGSDTPSTPDPTCSGSVMTGNVTLSKIKSLFFSDGEKSNPTNVVTLVGSGVAPDGTSQQQISVKFKFPFRPGLAQQSDIDQRRSDVAISCLELAKQAMATNATLIISDTIKAGINGKPANGSIISTTSGCAFGCCVVFSAEPDLLMPSMCNLSKP